MIFSMIKKKSYKGTILLLRNIKEIKEVLGFLDRLPLQNLIVKYNVDNYVKELKTLDIIKIAVLYFYSKERHLKHFLSALMDNLICCKLLGIANVSVQQVYKALKKRCWWFFYEAFAQVVKGFKDYEVPYHRLFKGKEIKIIDSTFLVYALSRIFFAKLGYCPSEQEYKPGIKLHVILKFNIIDEKILYYETGNVEVKIVELSNGLRVRYVKCLDFELICNDCSLQWYEIVSLYSFRWEIESLFKRLKQLWKINKPLFRNHNSIMAFICITLIAVIVFEKLLTMIGADRKEMHHIIGRKIELCLLQLE